MAARVAACWPLGHHKAAGYRDSGNGEFSSAYPVPGVLHAPRGTRDDLRSCDRGSLSQLEFRCQRSGKAASVERLPCRRRRGTTGIALN